jgi:16S rRNA (adenine1518-N6/adenine1519-N6)-dimethyltransferase
VMLAACFEASHLFDVPPEAFEPPPRVDSAVVRLVTKSPGERLSAQAIGKLELILARAFAQKRKMLRSAFIPWLHAQGLDSAAIVGTERAEDVPAEVYFAWALALLALDKA